MKLLKPSECQSPDGGGNVNRLTMIVEEQGIGFWTRVQIPSAPLKGLEKSRPFVLLI